MTPVNVNEQTWLKKKPQNQKPNKKLQTQQAFRQLYQWTSNPPNFQQGIIQPYRSLQTKGGRMRVKRWKEGQGAAIAMKPRLTQVIGKIDTSLSNMLFRIKNSQFVLNYHTWMKIRTLKFKLFPCCCFNNHITLHLITKNSPPTNKIAPPWLNYVSH